MSENIEYGTECNIIEKLEIIGWLVNWIIDKMNYRIVCLFHSVAVVSAWHVSLLI